MTDQLVGSWVEVHHEDEFVRAGIVEEVVTNSSIKSPRPENSRMTTSPAPIEVRAETAAEAVKRLAAAVGQLQDKGLKEGTRGILLVRISPGFFRVELSSRVPCGLTYEEDAWRR